MSKSIFITNSDDIPFALQVQQTDEITETIMVDPTLYGRAKKAGLKSPRLVYKEFAGRSNDWYYQGFEDADYLTHQIDHIISKTIPGIKRGYWFHGPFSRLTRKIRWNVYYWQNMIDVFEALHSIILLFDQPLLQSAHSFIPSLYLIEKLVERGYKWSAYRYGSEQSQLIALPDTRRFIHDGFCLDFLVHMPTCFYDKALFEREILSTGKSVIALPSAYWNIEFEHINQTGLISFDERLMAIDPDIASQISTAINEITSVVVDYLSRFFRSEYFVAKQSDFISNWFLAQMLFFHDLSLAFERRKPEKIILSDIDAGFHGPLVSLAAMHSIPVIYLQHAKAISWKPPVTDDLKAILLVHPGQGMIPISQNGSPLTTIEVDYDESINVETFRPKPLKVIGIILNDIFGTTGDDISIKLYIDGLKKILEWSVVNNVICKVRCRPGYEFSTWLSENTNISEMDLLDDMAMSFLDFSVQCDLCIGYDSPSTGEFELIRNGVALLNICIRDTIEERNNVISKKVIQTLSMDQSISLLNSFLSNDCYFLFFRKNQFLHYVQKLTAAQPIRTSLLGSFA